MLRTRHPSLASLLATCLVWLSIAGVSVVSTSTSAHAAQVPFSFFEVTAEAQVLHFTGDAPGLLPISPLLDVGLGHAKSTMTVAQNHAVASPLYPGGVITSLPSTLELVGINLPLRLQFKEPFYPYHAESFYPEGGTVKAGSLVGDVFSLLGFKDGNAEVSTTQDAVTAVSSLGSGHIANKLRVEGVNTSATTKIENGAMVATATTSVARMSVGDSIVLENLTATATDVSNGDADGDVNVGRCTVNGVTCRLTSEGLRFPGNADPSVPLLENTLKVMEQYGVVLKLGTPKITPTGVDISALEVVLTVPIEQKRPGVPLQTAQVGIQIGRAKASAAAEGPLEVEPEKPESETGGAGDDNAPVNTETVAVGRVAKMGPGIPLFIGLLGLLVVTIAGARHLRVRSDP